MAPPFQSHKAIKQSTLSSREHMLVSGNSDVLKEAVAVTGTRTGADKSPFTSAHKGRWDADVSRRHPQR
jgi:hypothetical protein